MTESEKLVGVCEDCKYITVYEGLDDNMEPDGELFFICVLSDEEVRLNHTCEEYEERPLFGGGE